MGEKPVTYALLVLACWRTVHLVTDDEVPFGGLRNWVDRKFPKYGWGLSCVFCMGVWFGGFFAALGWGVYGVPGKLAFLLWPALAATTVIIEAGIGWLQGNES